MQLSNVSSFLFGVMRVVGSAVVPPHGAVLIGGSGLAGYPDSGEDNAKGEGTPDAEAFGAPGIVWRPREREKVDGAPIGAEAFYVRTEEGPQPISWRDLRWHRMFPTIQAGTIALVGYLGQRLSFEEEKAPAADWGGGGAAPTVWAPRVGFRFPYRLTADGTPTREFRIEFAPDGTATLRQLQLSGGAETEVSAFSLTESGLTYEGPPMTINGAQITSGGEFVTATGVKLGVHTHPTAMGPSGQPITPTP